MKILILANNDVGLYKFRKELIQELLTEHDVYISLPDGDLVQPLIDMGCHFIDTKVDRRGINPFTDIKLLVNYYHMIKDIKPELVITYTIKPNIYGGIICRLLHIKYSINITGLGTAFQNDGFIKTLVSFMYKLSTKKASVVFFENKGNMQTFLDLKLVQEKQTYLLNGAGVNLDDYPFTEYPPYTDELHFLFIGRVMKEKGVDELFTSTRKLKQEYPNIHFDIVGPMEDNYQDIINNLVNENIIHYYGFQEDVKPYIKQCHCFVLPSYHEGMANTLLECAAMGRPLITSNIHGCMEAVKDNGLLCNVKDSNDLYSRIKEFIEMDYNQKKILGYNSRKLMEEVFDKRKVVEETKRGLKL